MYLYENKVKLINEDCFKVLPAIKKDSVDLILVDLPYIISKDNGFDRGGAWNNSEDKRMRKKPPKTDFGQWDKQPLDLRSLIKEFKRILKPSGTLIMFYDIFKMQELKEIADEFNFKQPRMCVWQKTNPVPLNSGLNYLSNSREYFISFVKKSKPTFNSSYDNGLYTFPICSGKERLDHPCQKPLSLIRELILKHSNKGDLVLDCFMGTNSVGEACFLEDRCFIGVDNDTHSFNIAVERAKRYIERGKNNEF